MNNIERKEILSKAKSILFNTEMVRAILDGRKTVTRRIVKNNPEECTSKVVNGVCKICDDKGGFYLPDDYVKVRSPYQAGDILYVRETWAELETVHGVPYWAYKADDQTLHHSFGENFERWQPSVHMPREAARIFLRITNVRIESLQDITTEQIEREGIYRNKNFNNWYTWGDGNHSSVPKLCFRHLWDSTIKKSDLDKYGWAANPYVWVIEFERID